MPTQKAIKDPITLFTKALSSRLSPVTVKMYVSIFNRLVKGKVSITSKSSWLQVKAVLSHAEGLGLKRYVKPFSFPSKWSAVPVDRSVKIKDSIVSLDSFNQCISTIRPIGKMKEAILAAKMAFYGGLRASEVLDLTQKDIDFTNGIKLTINGKGGKFRYSYLPMHLLGEIGVFTGFSISYNHLSEIINKCGIPGMHSLRHSFATNMMNEGMHIHELQRLLGHSSITTTALYLHLTADKPSKLTELGY